MTKKSSWVKSKDEEDARRPQEATPVLSKQGLTARTSSAKCLAPIEEKPAGILGKFSNSPVLSSGSPKAAPSPPPSSLSDMSTGRPRGLLIKAESNGALRRGTPRPGDLKKTMSTVKFVLEASGLDQVEEEDFEMA